MTIYEKSRVTFSRFNGYFSEQRKVSSIQVINLQHPALTMDLKKIGENAHIQILPAFNSIRSISNESFNSICFYDFRVIHRQEKMNKKSGGHSDGKNLAHSSDVHKTKFSYHSTCDMKKISPCSNVRRDENRPTFCALHRRT